MPTASKALLEKLNALIKLDGLSQAELARRVGIQPSHLNRFLKGHGDIRSFLFASLLEELGINIAQIIEREFLQRSSARSTTKSERDSNHIGDLLRGLPSAERRAVAFLVETMANENRGAQKKVAAKNPR